MADSNSEQQPVKLQALRNVKVKHMDRLTEKEMDLVMARFKYLKGKPQLGKHTAPTIEELPFSDVTNIRRLLDGKGTDTIKAVAAYFSYSEAEVVDFTIMEFWHARNYLLQEVYRINQLEEKALAREIPQKMQDAGVERLAVFGPFNSIDRVAQRYNCTPLEVEKWEYQLVFTVLWKMAIEDDINEQLASKK